MADEAANKRPRSIEELAESSTDSAVRSLINSRVEHLASALEIDVEAIFEALPHLRSDATTTPFTITPVADPVHALIDHTILKPDATAADVQKLCKEAALHHFAAVCVNGSRASLALETLRELGAADKVKVAAVIGFPLGAMTPASKAFETKELVQSGVQEIDMVINIGWVKDKNYKGILADIRSVVDAAQAGQTSPAIVKVIFETGLHSSDEIVDLSIISVLAGAQFIKTSTGFGGYAGAKADIIHLMKMAVGEKALVKASGGVRTLPDVQLMVKNGASRIGTSSGVAIIQNQAGASGY